MSRNDAQGSTADSSDIARWRLRAAEPRSDADQFGIPSVQDALREIAACYDELAEKADAALCVRAPGGKERV